MTLLDVDKNSADRTNPSPNSDDNIADGQRMAHSTISTSYNPNNENPSGARIQMLNKQIVAYDDTGTPRIFIGPSPDDGRMGIWISKPGLSVITLLGG